MRKLARSFFCFLCLLCGLKFSILPHHSHKVFHDEHNTDRLIVDVGVEGSGHHMVKIFIDKIHDCSPKNGEGIRSLPLEKKWENRPKPPPNRAPTLEESIDPQLLPRTAFNPIVINSSIAEPKIIEKETKFALETIQNMENYRKNGVTIYQHICSWPCGPNKFFSSSLEVTGKLLRDMNNNHNNSHRKWDLGVMVLVRDPVESLISHARQYLQHPLMQANLTRLALNDIVVQLTSVEKMLGEKYIPFAFTADLIKNLYFSLSPSSLSSLSSHFFSRGEEVKGRDGGRDTERARECVGEISKFLRLENGIVGCAVTKTGEELSKRAFSYGRDWRVDDEVGKKMKDFVDSLFEDEEYLWPIFYHCHPSRVFQEAFPSTLCPLPTPCLPFFPSHS